MQTKLPSSIILTSIKYEQSKSLRISLYHEIEHTLVTSHMVKFFWDVGGGIYKLKQYGFSSQIRNDLCVKPKKGCTSIYIILFAKGNQKNDTRIDSMQSKQPYCWLVDCK